VLPARHQAHPDSAEVHGTDQAHMTVDSDALEQVRMVSIYTGRSVD
jgi:hypothetical protein